MPATQSVDWDNISTSQLLRTGESLEGRSGMDQNERNYIQTFNSILQVPGVLDYCKQNATQQAQGATASSGGSNQPHNSGGRSSG